MKNQLIRFGLLGAVLAATIIGFTTLQKSPKPKAQGGIELQEFFYYPRSNIYYHISQQYFWLQDNKGNWKQVNVLEDSVRALLDQKVTVRSTTVPVWKDNDHHRLIYATSLYASPADLRPPPKRVIVASQQEQTSPDSITIEKKEKGLKKFLNKVFGKKKKKETPEQAEDPGAH